MNLFLNDFVGAGASLLLLICYYVFLRYQLKSDPLYTIQAVNAAARAAWVETVMTGSNKDVLAVQTLRNSMIARRRRLPTIAVSGAQIGRASCRERVCYPV